MEEENNPDNDQIINEKEIINEEKEEEPAGATLGSLIVIPRPEVLNDVTSNINGEGEYTIRIFIPLGKTLNPPLIDVYLGRHPAATSDDDQYEYFFVKYIDTNDQPNNYDLLLDQVNKNELVGPHENLLGIVRKFIHEQENSLYSLVFPMMHLGSLRTALKRKHPYGLPETLLLFILRETLKGLSVIHGAGQVHKEINAGHIFVNKFGEVKLAFAASVFESNADVATEESSSNASISSSDSICVWASPTEESSSYSSISSRDTICVWASAPEVHDLQEEYTAKADVWLIGITALELAYGGIRVNDREELIPIVEKIVREKALPKKRDNEYLQVRPEIKKKKIEAMVDKAKKVFSMKGGFSKKFGKMVAKCLDMDPGKRPTVNELLQKKVFTDLNLNNL